MSDIYLRYFIPEYGLPLNSFNIIFKEQDCTFYEIQFLNFFKELALGNMLFPQDHEDIFLHIYLKLYNFGFYV